MAFWWVNHKQTFREEVQGGYIWSPKTKSDGGANQTYTNLTLVNVGDIVFSYAFKKISCIGVVSSRYIEQGKPAEFGNSGSNWAKSGWAVPIDWYDLEKPFTPLERIQDFRDLLPAVHSPLKANGKGNQGCYLASISDDLGSLLLSFIQEESANAPSLDLVEDESSSLQEDAQIIEVEKDASIDATERQQIINARKGQGIFRRNVGKYESSCRVTGLEEPAFLIASHIKPWKFSDNAERLDGNNGLLLSPHIDKLFDRGWISFTDEGELLFAGNIAKEALKAWGIEGDVSVGSFNQTQCEYLAYHRQNVLRS